MTMTKTRNEHAEAQPSEVQPLRRKHVPMRMCVVCRERFPKRQITRIVYTGTGLQIDLTGKLHGRGAYLCDQAKCWERAASSDVLSKALQASLTGEDRERLMQAKPQS
jgi:uncharacterized protein